MLYGFKNIINYLTVKYNTINMESSPNTPQCPICESYMFKRHCKFICPNHGVILDCSDPFW